MSYYRPSAPPAPPAQGNYYDSQNQNPTWSPLPPSGYQPSSPSYGQPQSPFSPPPPSRFGYPEQRPSHEYNQQNYNQGPSVFPPGTDPEIVRMFYTVDTNRSGTIDDMELQQALSSYSHQFSIRTIHLLMYLFANNTRTIGPSQFAALWSCISEWRIVFERFDRDRSGNIDTQELRNALLSLGYAVSPTILQVLVSKYDRSGQGRAMDYDNFIECGIIVKGLTDMFKAKDTRYSGSATLSYETFMLMVIPYIVA